MDCDAPACYWSVPESVLANIKGARRRRVIRDALDRGAIEKLPAALFGDDLPRALRAILSSLHPSFMGGEYLPDAKPGEVEIARVTLPDTTLCDVISIRARRIKGGIAYRVVDEHESVFRCSPDRGTRPLTFAEIIDLIDTVETTACGYRGLVTGMWNYRVSCCGETPADRLTVSVTSAYYPGLERWYVGVAEQWDRERGVVAPEPPPSAEHLASVRRSLLANLEREERTQGIRRTDAQRESLIDGWIAMRWRT